MVLGAILIAALINGLALTNVSPGHATLSVSRQIVDYSLQRDGRLADDHRGR